MARQDDRPGYVPALGLRWLTLTYDRVVRMTAHEHAITITTMQVHLP